MKAAPQNYVVVALGSNLGDSIRIISDVSAELQRFTDRPLLFSSLWESAPIDCPPGSPMFINAVAAFIPRLSETPESLFAQLRELEKKYGRKAKTMHNEPRPLDLDLIAFQTELRRTTELTLPHPRACGRAFVLAPLCEVLPNLVLPGQDLNVSDVLKTVPLFGMRKL